MALVTEMTFVTRIQDLKHSLLGDGWGVVLKESPGKSMGAFATNAFQKNDFVTIYPSHMVGVQLESERIAWLCKREYTMEYIDKLGKAYGQQIMDGFIAGGPELLEEHALVRMPTWRYIGASARRKRT